MPLIDIGSDAPQFSLGDQFSKTHALADYRRRPVVIYFYPKDDTPGCTTEACDFRDLLPEMMKAGAAVIGISPDSAASHAAFSHKFKLNFTPLADPHGADGVPPVCDAYGVWHEKNMYGQKSMGVGRTTYLIDAAGKVAQRWDRVKVEGHAADVLEAVQALRAAASAQPA